MDLNNLTPEQQQQVVLILQQIQGQATNTNAAEKIASALQQQASTKLVENIKILAALKLLSAHVQQQPNNVAQDKPFEGQAFGANNNAPIGDSSVLLQQILELKQQMINNPNDEGFGLQGQPPQQSHEQDYYPGHDNGNYRRDNSPPRWHRDRDTRDRDIRDRDYRERDTHRDYARDRHSPPRRERSPPHHGGSSGGRQRPPKWVRDQTRAEKSGPAGTIPTQPPPIGKGAVFTAQNPTDILASYLTDEDVVIPKFSLMQPLVSSANNNNNNNNNNVTPKRPPRPMPAQDTPPQAVNPLPVSKPTSDELIAPVPGPSPVKATNGPPPPVGKVPSTIPPKKMPSSPLKGPSPNGSGKLPPPARKGPPLSSPKPAKVSLEGIPPPYPPPKFPPKQPMHTNPAPSNPSHSQPQPMPPKQYPSKVNLTPPPRTTFPPKQTPKTYPQQPSYPPQSSHPQHSYPPSSNNQSSYPPQSRAPQHAHVQHPPPHYSQPQHYQPPLQHPPTQPAAQAYYQHTPPQVPNAAPTSAANGQQGRPDLFRDATVEDLQQVHQFLTEVLEIQQEAAKDKSRAAPPPRVVPSQPAVPGKPAQQVGPALPPQSSGYVPPQVKQPPLLTKRPASAVETPPVAFKKHKTAHPSYPPTAAPKQGTYPPSAQPMPVAPMHPQAVPPQPVPYPAAYPPGYQYPYPYPAYDYNAAYQYYYGAYAPTPGVAPTAAASYPPPGYYPAVPPGYPKK